MSSTKPTRAELLREVEELREEVRKLRQSPQDHEPNILLGALDSVSSLVSFIDADGIYRYNNRRYEEWFGLERADLRGKRVVDVIGEKAFETTQEYVRRALEGKDANHTNLITKLNGETVSVETKFLPRKGPTGDHEGYFAIVEDVSERDQAQNTLSQILDCLPVSVTVVDEDDRYVFVNTAEANRWGYKQADAIGRTTDDILPKNIAENANRESRQVRETGEPLPFFEETSSNGGKKRVMLISKAPLKDLSGEVSGVCLTALDITERSQSEEQLQRSKDSYRASLDLLPDAVYVTIDDVIVYTNAAAVAQFGGEPERSLSGQLSIELFHPDERPRIYTVREQIAATGQTHALNNYKYMRLDGTEFTGEGSATHITWDGRPALIVLIRDVTDRLREQMALVESEARAGAASSAKSDFLAVMSHEIRTPMNGVMGAADVLALTDLSPDQKEFVDTIKESGSSLLSLLNDILDLSKIEAGHVELEEHEFLLDYILEGTRKLWSQAADDKGLELVLINDSSERGFIRCDLHRLRQVINNLVSNALKFTERGRIEMRIRDDHREDETLGLRFELQDTGIGVTEEQAEKIFQPFTQADSSTTRTYGGTGLGLTISKKLVEVLGGEMGVDSVPGHGSTFWFTISARRGNGQAETFKAQSRTETTSAIALQDRPLRILVAEDNTTNQKIISWLLAPLDCQIDVVENGVQAVAAITRSTYDLVLMDAQMPEMDGLEATQNIRSLGKYGAGIPIIALTANAMKGDRERYLDAGMTDYVPKPIDQRELLAAICRWTDIPVPDFRPAPAGAAPDEKAPSIELSDKASADLKDLISDLDNLIDETGT